MARKPQDKDWQPLSALAERLGLTRQAVSQRVARLEGLGLITTRAGAGRTKLVNVREFTAASAAAGDAVRTLNGSGAKRGEKSAAPPSGRRRTEPETEMEPRGQLDLAYEQTRRTNISADLLELRLQQQLGQLLRTKDVEAAMVRCAEAMVRIVNALPARAEELAAAVAKDGVNGARKWLRQLSVDLRTALANEMRLLAGDKPEAPARIEGHPKPLTLEERL
jgi:biotin operon repressor